MKPLSCCSFPSPSPPSLRKLYAYRAPHFPIARRPSVTAMADALPPIIIQARISAAASVGRLDLSNCGLEEVPPEVFALRDLEELSLAWNNLTHIPDAIGSMTDLRHLSLSGNWLEGLPDSIGNLRQLESLWVQGNLLQSLPDEVGNLGQLSVLNVTGNMLDCIPESVSLLSCLNLLSLSGNKLEHLPAGLGNLASLKILSVNGNLLQSLPTSLHKLSSLQKLSLQGNRIKYLPTNLTGLSSLKEVSVADNELLDLPESIGELECLESLSLYGNKISQIPSSICNLKQLRGLWLEGNPLNTLPESLLSLTNLKSLGVDSKTALSMKVPPGVGKVLQICEMAGSGLASSLGGYFKLQLTGGTRSDNVVVAFGSAPGVPNWGRLLDRVKAAMLADNKRPAFDVLYVVDGRRSWYTETKSGQEGRHQLEFPEIGVHYGRELQEAVKGYKRIIMLGDSMGASAGLLFSQFATAVIAFCPQVDMTASAIRPGRDKSWLNKYKEELVSAVEASSAHIIVHCGSWEHDKDQAKLLPEKVDVVVHSNDSHRLAKALQDEGSLLTLIRKQIEEEFGMC